MFGQASPPGISRIVEFGNRNPAPGRFTWFDYRGGSWEKKHGLRIDYVYATGSVYERCTEVIHDWEPRAWDGPSDHVPVTAKFSG